MTIKEIYKRISNVFSKPPVSPIGKDGLPIPPPELINLVAGTDDLDWFWKSGALGADSMLEILKKNGLVMEEFNSVLDFGCGIGRVLRHFNNIHGPVFYGTDYNPKLINWCKKNLKFARFSTNQLVGSLEYIDQQFDFIYA
jgi:SAM-dependent methyltransferase